MSIRIAKPTGNARRQMSFVIHDVDKVSPEKSLSFGKKRISGRNNNGRVTVRGRGVGAKRLIRTVDLNQASFIDQHYEVISIQYDPNRSSHIALVKYESGELSYILSPEKIKIGAHLICKDKTPIKVGNRMKLENIPASTEIFNIEIAPGSGGKMVRSAGVSAVLLGVDDKYALVRLPSGEVRKVLKRCFATIGGASNSDHSKQVIGNAGRKRHMGIKPHVRGKAKNPVDHPHGGGEGGCSIGMKHPKTPWGMPALGHKTRKRNKKSSRLIIEKRKK